ncbi:MAG: hypothetical protein WAW84_02255 [Candidatus Rickettsiella isopodorum]|nr:hypothetical protein [Candidatus Rickettsiella isopodorum]MDD5162113.1 hypothetical protein [Candidatus Rickettsiella isopodorum]
MLVTVLFFLFITSLMTVSILSHSYLELGISRNLLIASQQFQAAEAGLKLTESWLKSRSTPIFALHKRFNYAGFQISSELRRHRTSYCINQSQAYIYDVIVQAKQTTSGALSLQTTYAIKTKNRCQSGDLALTKTGRSSWRELNSLS